MSYQRFRVYESSPITAMCGIPDTKVVVTGGGHGAPLLLNFLCDEGESQSIQLPCSNTGIVHAVDVASLRKIVASTSSNTISLHDVSKNTPTRQLYNNVMRGSEYYTKTLSRALDTVLDARFMDENVVVACGINHHLAFFDIRIKRQYAIATINAGSDNLNSLTFDPQNPAVVTAGSSSGHVYMLDVRNQVLVYDEVSSHPVVGVAEVPGKKCLARITDGTIAVIDQDNARQLESIRYNSARPMGDRFRYNVVYEPLTSHIIAGNDAGTVRMWHWDDHNQKAKPMTGLKIELSGKDPHMINFLTTTRYMKHSNTIIASSGEGCIHSWSAVF